MMRTRRVGTRSNNRVKRKTLRTVLSNRLLELPRSFRLRHTGTHLAQCPIKPQVADIYRTLQCSELLCIFDRTQLNRVTRSRHKLHLNVRARQRILKHRHRRNRDVVRFESQLADSQFCQDRREPLRQTANLPNYIEARSLNRSLLRVAEIRHQTRFTSCDQQITRTPDEARQVTTILAVRYQNAIQARIRNDLTNRGNPRRKSEIRSRITHVSSHSISNYCQPRQTTRLLGGR